MVLLFVDTCVSHSEWLPQPWGRALSCSCPCSCAALGKTGGCCSSSCLLSSLPTVFCLFLKQPLFLTRRAGGALLLVPLCPLLGKKQTCQAHSRSPSWTLSAEHFHFCAYFPLYDYRGFTGGQRTEEVKQDKDDIINIFSVASGHLYERFLRLVLLVFSV